MVRFRSSAIEPEHRLTIALATVIQRSLEIVPMQLQTSLLSSSAVFGIRPSNNDPPLPTERRNVVKVRERDYRQRIRAYRSRPLVVLQVPKQAKSQDNVLLDLLEAEEEGSNNGSALTIAAYHCP
jgi:hypothetical protein